jgi:hypothetical protein
VVGKGVEKAPGQGRVRRPRTGRAQDPRWNLPASRGTIGPRHDPATKGHPAGGDPKGGTAMSGKIALIVLIAATAVVVSVASSLAGMGDSGDHMGGGGVVRCSLDGINPAHHPEIFGNPAVAASYGFVRSRDGTWHVAPNCRR